jgi:hypothetical protein
MFSFFRLDIKEVSDSTAQFDNVGVTIQPCLVKTHLVILIKRQNLESSKVKIPLLEEEDLSSDVITVRMLQNPEGASARFSLPLFDTPISSREEIVVKSGTGSTYEASEMQAGNHVSLSDLCFFLFWFVCFCFFLSVFCLHIKCYYHLELYDLYS